MHKHIKISIVYTSDVHGKLISYDFITKNDKTPSLSRFYTYIKSIDNPILLLDNGDILQGSPLLDMTRDLNTTNPVSKAFNLIQYDFYTLGNHDFNYGQSYLKNFIENTHANLLCANILNDENKPYFKPYAIKEIKGIKIGIIGVTTAITPLFEKKAHLKGMHFIKAYDAVKKYSEEIKDKTDAIIVLYHGGYEKDLKTLKPKGKSSVENEGYAIFHMPEIDCLLCGHQHETTLYKYNLKSTIQTASEVNNFGQVDLIFNEHKKIIDNEPKIIKNNFEPDLNFEKLFIPLTQKTDQYLDKIIAHIKIDMTIKDQFLARKNNHVFFQFINMIQKNITQSDISLASLPNFALGISKAVTQREIAANFVYVNAIVKMEITGKILKEALEKNACYFSIDNHEIVINKNYLYPKLQHYNFDIYDGINYTYNISNPLGKRLVECKFNHKDVSDSDVFTICLNSYRANGGGDFHMFTKGKILKTYDVDYVNLMLNYIKKHPQLMMVSNNQFKVIF